MVVLDIDTFGGYVDAAIAIKNTVIAQSLETLAFVDGKAISAGSLIAFSGKQLVMMPGSTIGAAEPRSGGVDVYKRQPFDPQIHEAIGNVEVAEDKKGLVVTEVQKGYLFKDKLLRPSIVQVGV